MMRIGGRSQQGMGAKGSEFAGRGEGWGVGRDALRIPPPSFSVLPQISSCGFHFVIVDWDGGMRRTSRQRAILEQQDPLHEGVVHRMSEFLRRAIAF